MRSLPLFLLPLLLPLNVLAVTEKEKQETAKQALKVVSNNAATNAQQGKQQHGDYWTGWQDTKDDAHFKQVLQEKQKHEQNKQTSQTINQALGNKQQGGSQKKGGKKRRAVDGLWEEMYPREIYLEDLYLRELYPRELYSRQGLEADELY